MTVSSSRSECGPSLSLLLSSPSSHADLHGTAAVDLLVVFQLPQRDIDRIVSRRPEEFDGPTDDNDEDDQQQHRHTRKRCRPSSPFHGHRQRVGPFAIVTVNTDVIGWTASDDHRMKTMKVSDRANVVTPGGERGRHWWTYPHTQQRAPQCYRFCCCHGLGDDVY